MVCLGVPGVMLALAGLLTGCGADLTSVEAVHGPATVDITDAQPRNMQLRMPRDLPVMVTVSARGVDVKATVVGTGQAPTSDCDAPNRRMGVESLFVEAPHAEILTIRLQRNDHSQAGGTAVVEAAGLPLLTEADRARLAGAQQDARACLAFPDTARGDAAAADYEQAARSWNRAGDRRREGLALLQAAGVRYQRHGDWQSASELSARALDRLEDSGDEIRAAFALRLEGAALDQLANAGNYDLRLREATVARARERLLEAEQRFRKLGMPYEAGFAASYRAVSIGVAGDFERARELFRVALDLFREAGDPPAQAVVLQSLAFQSFQDGRSADAAREFEDALALVSRDDDAANYAHTLHNSALPLRTLGQFDEAIARHHEAALILRRLGDRDGEARALHSLAIAMMNIGQTERARELLRTAIELRGQTGVRREQAVALVNLAELERDAGRAESALALDRRALELVTAPQDRSRVLLALARDQLAAGRQGRAREHLEAVLGLDLPASHRFLGLALAELAALKARAGDAEGSEGDFARALAIHEANDSELERARTVRMRAEARLDRGDLDGARADAAAALVSFDAIGIRSLHAEARAAFRASYRDAVELRIATLLRDPPAGADRQPVAQAQLQAALAASDRARAQLLVEPPVTRVPPSLLLQQQQTYELLAGKRQQHDRLLESAQSDTARAQALARDIELLRTKAGLIDGRIAQAREAAPGGNAVPPAGEAVPAPPPGVLALEFFIGRRQSWLFEVQDGTVTAHTLGPGPGLDALARALHMSWRKPMRQAGARGAAAHRLARILFEQAGDPAAFGEVWIVPDGGLHLVPMALLARQAWPGLAEGAAIVKPALSTLRPAGGPGADGRRLLALVADPVYGADDPRLQARHQSPATAPASADAAFYGEAESLRRLPSTAVEARELMALVDRPQELLALLGPDASRENVVRADLGRYRIVHFATHAFADSRDPGLASIALSRFGAQGEPLDGALRLFDVLQLRLRADLVVLSGCDTALGHEIAGEGPIGLSHAFLRAGASSVLATLWQVPDTSTAVLIREFYRQLLEDGRTAPDALAIAQQRLRRQPRWSDPYYWAGFQLVSNTRPEAGHNNNVTGREES